MNYLLLTKYITPGGDQINWEVYGDLEAAKIRLKRLQQSSRQYDGLPLIAPVLVQHLIVKVEAVE